MGQPAQVADGVRRQGLHGFRNIEATVPRQPGEKDLGKAQNRGLAPRAHIAQDRYSACRRRHAAALARGRRSEEHTSELQYPMRISYAVLCLKKNNIKTIT